MKLKNIQIQGLYQKYDTNWKLDQNINILIGDNGAYKTTLLKILAALCNTKDPPSYYRLFRAVFEFDNGMSLNYRHFHDSLLHLKNEAKDDELLKDLEVKISADLINEDNNSLADRILEANVIKIKSSEGEKSIRIFQNLIHFDSIATFDVPSKQDEKSDKSTLDVRLEKLENLYAYYLSDLSKKLSNRIMQNGKVDKADYEEIYNDNYIFMKIINDAFINSNKKVDTSKSKLQFKIGEESLDSNLKLSSGEKQLLIVLLTVLLQEKEETILIMDEPEISMHIEWQRNLLVWIQKLNPNCQIILATHSPAVVMDGWEQSTTNISSIITNREA